MLEERKMLEGLHKEAVGALTRFIWLRTESGGGLFRKTAPIRGRKFLDQLSNYRLSVQTSS